MLILLILLSALPNCAHSAEPPEVSSQNVILIDADTGNKLFGKNEDVRAYPASTTKIMVALLALENLELDEMVTTSATALNMLPPGYTNIGLKEGEQLSVRQLLYALMLSSAGDAANALAERMSGSIDEFVKLMNRRALELGMTSTNFTNTSGVHDERHYSTAADLAILAREAMKNETFREIVATDLYIIPPTAQYTEERRLSNTNYLVSSRRTAKYFYANATGIKTGFTNAAKLCLVSSAEKNGVSLICVALGSDTVDDDMTDFTDAINLFNYAFANFKQTDVVKANTIVAQAPIKSAKKAKQVLLEAAADITKLYPIGEEMGKIEHTDRITENIKAPIKKGEVLGVAEYYVDSELVGQVDLIADKDYAFDPVKNILGAIAAIFTSPFLYIPLILMIIGVLLIRQYNYNRYRRARIEARRKRMQKDAEERRKSMSMDSYFDDFMK